MIQEVKRALKKMEFTIGEEDFNDIWESLEPDKLNRMSANELAKTIKFRIITREEKTNFAFALDKYTNLPDDKLKALAAEKKLHRELNGFKY